MNELSLEKQFSHTMFCQQVQDIDLESAKQLLADLHLLYITQQSMFAKLAKQDALKDFFAN
jgi:Phycobilisome degradation protein nblA